MNYKIILLFSKMNLYDDHEKKEENKDDPENNDLMEEMWQSMTEQK